MPDRADRRAPGPSVDLNADLGESFGAWRLGDDEALLTVVTSANIACGFHAGDPLTIRRALRGRGRARGGHRRPGLLPRPGRLRPPGDGRAAGRADRRGAVPDRRAGRDRPDRGRPGPLRQAARRPVQPAASGTRSRPRRWRPRSRPTTPALPLLTLPGSGAARGRRRRRAHRRRRGLRRPGLPRRRHAVSRAASRAPCITDPAGSPPARSPWPPRHVAGVGGRAARSRSGPVDLRARRHPRGGRARRGRSGAALERAGVRVAPFA